MLLCYHQLEVIYHFYEDYSLPFIAYKSVNFMIIDSKADFFFFCFVLICYIVDTFIKNMKCHRFRYKLFLPF